MQILVRGKLNYLQSRFIIFKQRVIDQIYILIMHFDLDTLVNPHLPLIKSDPSIKFPSVFEEACKNKCVILDAKVKIVSFL